ncbi:unnamed protein product [Allacma fusca]|uniref:Uncharacterized protein n=1 Tax=Allacma fusca TaxID=39272 RepID=A0A8J2P1L6_9HEXA|nr:unnamed protein product [Allacma fusca]
MALPSPEVAKQTTGSSPTQYIPVSDDTKLETARDSSVDLRSPPSPPIESTLQGATSLLKSPPAVSHAHRTNLSDRFERMEDRLSVQEPSKETESNEWYLAYCNEVQELRIKLLSSEFVLANYRAKWFQYFLALTNTDSHHSLNVSVFDTRTDAFISEDYEDFQLVLDLDDLRNYSPPSGWERFKKLHQVLTMRIVSLPKMFCFTCASQEHNSTACDQPSQPDTAVRIDLEDRLEQLQQLIAQAEGVLLSTKLSAEQPLPQQLTLLSLPSSQDQTIDSSGSDYRIISLMNPWTQLPNFRSFFAPIPPEVTICVNDNYFRKFYSTVLAALSVHMRRLIRQDRIFNFEERLEFKWESCSSDILNLVWELFYDGKVNVHQSLLSQFKKRLHLLRVPFYTKTRSSNFPPTPFLSIHSVNNEAQCELCSMPTPTLDVLVTHMKSRE